MAARAALLSAVLFAAGPVLAQSQGVTVNPGALDLLPSRPAARPAPARPATPTSPHPAPARMPAPPATAPAQPAPTRPPAVPTVPPAIAAIPPAVAVPVGRPPPAPVVPVAADAPGIAAPVSGGLRVTFGSDRSDLNPATEAALREFARGLKANEAATVNVYAYASGGADDPSTPRRLSLARALAARGVLINEGIASTRIYPRALGPAGGDTDRDRVDLITGAPAPPATARVPGQ